MIPGKQYLKDLKNYRAVFERIAKEYRVPASALRLDCVRCALLHGANAAQYISFSMYRMNRRERLRFVTAGRSRKLEPLFNAAPAEEIRMIGDKMAFNRAFAQFVQRRWLYTPEADAQALHTFLNDCGDILVKPVDKTKGAGIRLLDRAEVEAAGEEAFLASAQADKLLLEERVRQHPALNAVNPSSVNTIRIATVRDRSGEVRVIGASLRGGGKGKIVDNLHAEGVQYPVDVESGCVMRGGVRYDGTQNVLFHPSTGEKVIGLQIPNWDKVIDTVKQAAMLPGHLRYIGWDVAVTEDGCELIEANLGQGSNGMQQDGVGKYPIIMRYL